MKKQPEITDKTRKAFIDAFCELYSQKPIEKISVQEIANKSGYNRSTFYQYFSDMYELLTHIENDVLNHIRYKLQSTKHSDLRIKDYVEFYNEIGVYLNPLLGEYGNFRFLERLKAEIARDEYSLNLPEEYPLTPYIIEFHVSTSLSLFRLWQRRQKDIQTEELFGLLDKLYTNGLKSMLHD